MTKRVLSFASRKSSKQNRSIKRLKGEKEIKKPTISFTLQPPEKTRTIANQNL